MDLTKMKKNLPKLKKDPPKELIDIVTKHVFPKLTRVVDELVQDPPPELLALFKERVVAKFIAIQDKLVKKELEATGKNDVEDLNDTLQQCIFMESAYGTFYSLVGEYIELPDNISQAIKDL